MLTCEQGKSSMAAWHYALLTPRQGEYISEHCTVILRAVLRDTVLCAGLWDKGQQEGRP